MHVCDFVLFLNCLQQTPGHANPTIIYENIKEIHIVVVGGTLEFPILSHMLLRNDYSYINTPMHYAVIFKGFKNDYF